MAVNKSHERLQQVVLWFIALAPLLYLNLAHNVPGTVFILGTGSWGIGCLFKMVAHQAIVLPIGNKFAGSTVPAVGNGLLSGLGELGAAYGVIWLAQEKLPFTPATILGFGLAIGAFEILLTTSIKTSDLMKGTAFEHQAQQLENWTTQLQGVDYFLVNTVLPVCERILATVLHVSTRGLVFIAFYSGHLAAFGVALAAFTIVDGVLGYGFYMSGKLNNRKGLLHFYAYLTLLAVTIATVFVVWLAAVQNR